MIKIVDNTKIVTSLSADEVSGQPGFYLVNNKQNLLVYASSEKIHYMVDTSWDWLTNQSVKEYRFTPVNVEIIITKQGL